MYHLNSSLPAPYELNNSMNSTTSMNPQTNSAEAPSFARGGRAKHKKILAHFNPKELHVMDHLQGHTERCPKTGLKSYSHLEELFKNPHIVGNVHKHNHAHREHHAMGGNIDQMAHEGRHGDTEMALIGPHTNHLFHQIAGRSTTNPHTGHPEFWSLGGLSGILGTAGRNLATGASKFAKVAAPIARKTGTAIIAGGKAAAPHIGTAFNTLAPIAAKVGTEYLTNRLQNMNKPQEEQQEYSFNPENMVQYLPESMQDVGKAAAGGYNAYRGGAKPEQAFGKGLSQYGQQRGGAMGDAMQGFGGALDQGQDWRSAAGNAASRVGEGYGGAFGGALQHAGNAYGRGQNMRQSFEQGANQGFQHMGGREGMINSGADILRSYGRPGGMQRAASRIGQGYMNRALPQYFPEQQESEYQDQYPSQEQDNGYGGYGY